VHPAVGSSPASVLLPSFSASDWLDSRWSPKTEARPVRQHSTEAPNHCHGKELWWSLGQTKGCATACQWAKFKLPGKHEIAPDRFGTGIQAFPCTPVHDRGFSQPTAVEVPELQVPACSLQVEQTHSFPSFYGF
jgi:hypothetical protein